jgi:hypothetical protein
MEGSALVKDSQSLPHRRICIAYRLRKVMDKTRWLRKKGHREASGLEEVEGTDECGIRYRGSCGVARCDHRDGKINRWYEASRHMTLVKVSTVTTVPRKETESAAKHGSFSGVTRFRFCTTQRRGTWREKYPLSWTRYDKDVVRML